MGRGRRDTAPQPPAQAEGASHEPESAQLDQPVEPVEPVEQVSGEQVDEAAEESGGEIADMDVGQYLADTSHDDVFGLAPSLMLHLLAEHNRYGALALPEDEAEAAHRRLHKAGKLERPHDVEDHLFRPAVAARIAVTGSRDLARGVQPEVP